MKHFLFMLAVTLLGSIAAIAVPFWGVLLYYGFATLRPQYLWDWSLAQAPTVRWSLGLALVTIVATCINMSDLLRSFRLNTVIVLLLAYASLMLLSMLTAYDTSKAFIWAEEYGKVFLMACIATMVVQRYWQVRAMAVMIAVCLGYIAYEVNYMYFLNGGRLDIYHHGYGGLDNNGAGALLVLGLPFVYFLAVTPVGKWNASRRIFFCVLGLVLLHAVMMTFSRGAMLTAALGIIWLLIHHRPRFQAAAVMGVLCVAVMFMAGDEIRERFISTADYQSDESAQSRFDSWEAAWNIALDNPLLGKGIRNSNDFSQNYGADLAGRTIHNQYLQIAADSGIPAAGIYITMIGVGIFGLRMARKRCLDAEQDFEDGPEPRGPHTREELVSRARDGATLCLAIQTALLMFAFTSVFLSVEMVEVPWLLITLSGILPAALDRKLRGLAEPDDDQDGDDDGYAPPPDLLIHRENQDEIQIRPAA